MPFPHSSPSFGSTSRGSLFGSLLLVAACGGEPEASRGTEAVGSSSQALTQTQREILGFERLDGWSLGSGTKSLSGVHTEGQYAFALAVGGWTELESVPLGPLAETPDSLYLDFRVPKPPGTTWWFGAVQMFVTIPSRNIYNEYVGQNELTGKPLDTFTTLAYPLPALVKEALRTHPSDVKIKVALNVPYGQSAYHLDALRFQPGQLPPDGGGEKPACDPFVSIGQNGDVRYEVVARPDETNVQLKVLRNGVADPPHLDQRLTVPKAVLPNGNRYYALIDPAARYSPGDTLDVRFSLDRAGPNGISKVYRPGPTAAESAKLRYGTFSGCVPQLDRDQDGVVDAKDACPDDRDKVELGLCPCGVSETDTDGDKTPDCLDECDSDPTHVRAGTCGCKTRPAPAGTECSDGALPGTFRCDGAGTCGSVEAVRPPWATGAIRQVETADKIVLVFPQDSLSWDEARRLAPAGYELVRIDERSDNAELVAIMKAANLQTVWLDAKVVGGGVVAHVSKSGQVQPFWDTAASPKSLDRRYTNWAAGQPPSSTGCVMLSADGTWRAASCVESHPIIYVRSKHVLSVHTGMLPVGCSDFPGLQCAPNQPPGSEPCTTAADVPPECENCNAPSPECVAICAQRKCHDCLALHEGDDNPDACAADCPNLACDKCRADQPEAGACEAVCGASPGASACRSKFSKACEVTPSNPAQPTPCQLVTGCDGQPPTCTPTYSCPVAGQVCGIVVSAACRACRDAANDVATCAEACQSLQACGVPRDGCGLDPADTGACFEELICAEPGAEGHPDPDGLTLAGLAEPQPFVPSAVFAPAPLAQETQYPSDSRTQAPAPGQPDPWCNYANSAPLPKQNVEDTRKGQAGSGKVLQFDIDPNVTLNYELNPLPLGQFGFDLKAEASLKALAKFDVAGIKQELPIIEAVLSAKASRCVYGTKESKLDLFGRDFIPFMPDRLRALLEIDEKIDGCTDAVAAYQEVADRAKKAMNDAQELLRQYHEGLQNGVCLNGVQLCEDLRAKAPSGFPMVDCAEIAVEDLINLFIFYYHAQLGGDLGMPRWSTGKLPQLTGKWPRFPDARLKNPTFKDLLPSGGLNFENFSGMSALPSLGDAASQLAKFKPVSPRAATGDLDPKWIDQFGCGAGAKTERQTLLEKPFSLGPIPMLLEVESVLRYGIDGQLDFDFRPDELVGLAMGSNAQATIASVTASARPCVSAGLGMFVGAGFKGYGFRATAGVEGVVNLGTLSAPAHATAAIHVSAQDEAVSLEPQNDAVVSKSPRVVRELPDSVKGLWDGPKLPIPQRRYRVDLSYGYGLALKADEILAGHLKASLQIKFWRWRKRWSRYLVNFGNGISLGEQQLLSGGDKAALLGGVPWGSLQMPSPFVKFRYLDKLPTGLIGATPAQISQRLPGLKVPVGRLAELDWDLGRINGIKPSLADLAQMGERLGYRDVLGELQAKGVDIAHLKLSDFSQLEFDLSSFHSAPLRLEDLQALQLSLDQLATLGINLPSLAPDRLNLEGVSVGHLAKLSLPSERLAKLQIDWSELPELSFLLDKPELEQLLRDASVDLPNLRLADFASIGVKVEDFRGFALTPLHVGDLDLTPAELRQLGVDLSGLGLDVDGNLATLPQRGLNVSALRLSDLSKLGLTLGGLGAISLTMDRFLELTTALNVPDIQAALRGVGVDPANATLADLSKVGLELADVPNLSLDVSSLNLGASELIQVGLGSELQRITDLNITCPKTAVSNQRVGNFFYERQCACQAEFDATQPFSEGRQSCSSDQDCCAGLTCLESRTAGHRVCGRCPAGTSGCSTEEVREQPLADVCYCLFNDDRCGATCPYRAGSDYEQMITQDFGPQQPLASYRVFLENAGTAAASFDDRGFVDEPLAPDYSQSFPITTDPPCGMKQVGALLGPIEITHKVRRMQGNILAFKLRSADECNTAIGWSGVKVRWVVSRGPTLP